MIFNCDALCEKFVCSLKDVGSAVGGMVKAYKDSQKSDFERFLDDKGGEIIVYVAAVVVVLLFIAVLRRKKR